MLCRRCGKDIMEGSKNCPICGISQNTYITPRNYSEMTVKKKKPRNNRLISLMMVVISLFAIYLMMFFSGRATEKADFQKILDAYEQEDDQLLMMTIAKYRNRYPKSTERIAEAEEYLLILRGYGPEEPSDDNPRNVITTYADSRIGFESIVLGEPNFENAHSLTIYWRNISGKTITHIYFKVFAYDSAGNKTNCTVRGKSEALLEDENKFKPNPEGDVYRSNWLSVWYGEKIEYVKIEEVAIYYNDNTSEMLPVRR